MIPADIEGRDWHIRVLTANEWFACTELEKQRDQDYSLIAKAVVTGDGNQALTKDDIGGLSILEFQQLYNKVIEVHKPEKDPKD